MIKLLCIAPYRFLPALTGGQKAIFLLYKYLSKKLFFSVAGTVNNQGNEEGFKMYKIFQASPSRYASRNSYSSLEAIVRKEEITHISIEHPYMGIYALRLQRKYKIKFVVRSHNIEAERFRSLKKSWWRLLFYYEKYVHQKADHSFFITPEDRAYAISHYKLSPEKTSVLTYGTELDRAITPEEKSISVQQLKSAYNIPEGATLLLFNGSFDYRPNLAALELLLETIMPALLQKDPDYFLLVCGKSIPGHLAEASFPQVKITGFVEDIEAVFKGAEIFVNPVWLGGGIKTKLVEALAAGCAAVSFSTGAIGITEAIVYPKLKIAEDLATEALVEAIRQQKARVYEPTPATFYDTFSWENIAKKYIETLQSLT